MTPVVFATPFLGFNTLRFIRAAAALPEVKLGLVTASPAEAIPADLRPADPGQFALATGPNRHQAVTPPWRRRFRTVRRCRP